MGHRGHGYTITRVCQNSGRHTKCIYCMLRVIMALELLIHLHVQ